ncbi:putative protein phosphatase 2C, partial [Toxoplasma gondii CAST]
ASGTTCTTTKSSPFCGTSLMFGKLRRKSRSLRSSILRI